MNLVASRVGPAKHLLSDVKDFLSDDEYDFPDDGLPPRMRCAWEMLTSCLACGSTPLPPLPPAHYSISRGNNQPAIYLGICLMPGQQSAQEYVLTWSHTQIYLSRGSNEHSTKDKNAFPCDCAFFNLSSLHKFSQVILRQFWQFGHPCHLPTVSCLDPSKQHSHILQPMRVERISFW